MKLIFSMLITIGLLTGCSTSQIYMSECRSICKENKVELYKDDNLKCKCNNNNDDWSD